MKKIISVLVSFSIFCCATVSNAQIITRNDMGISVYIDDN